MSRYISRKSIGQSAPSRAATKRLASAFAFLLLPYVSICLFAHESTAQQRDPANTNYYIANGDYLNVKISPEAGFLAALVRSEEAYALVFMKADDFSVVGGMKTANGELILNYDWVNEERVVFTVADFNPGWELPSGTGELWAVNRDGSDIDLLAGYRAQDASRASRIKGRERSFATFNLIHTLPDDPKSVLVVEYPWERRGGYMYDTRGTFPTVYKLNVKSAKLSKVAKLPHRGAYAFADAKGELRYLAWQSGGTHLKTAYRENKKSEWMDAAELVGTTEAPNVYGIDAKTGHIYFGITEGDAGLEHIVSYSPSSGERTVLLDSLESDVTNVFYDPKTTLPVGVVSIPDRPQYDYIDPQNSVARFHRGLAKAFEGQLVDISDSDREGNMHVIRVESDTNPGEFYLYDSRTKEARFVFANRSWMDVTQLAPKIALEVSARDGEKVPALLTLPTERRGGQTQLIVYAHGGPHGIRAPWQFEEEVQLLAARGFAVLQVNHRGSGGYGLTFLEKGYRQWGGAMIDDIEDVVEEVLRRHEDLGAVCSYGASYGGYASLVLAARNPPWLRCAAGFAGVYDLAAKYDKGDIPSLPFGKEYLEKAIGRDEQELRQFSPVNHATEINVPVLLIHGGKDRRVPIYHAKVMRDALNKAGKSVELKVDSKVGHGIYGEERRAQHWDQLMGFFKESAAYDVD